MIFQIGPFTFQKYLLENSYGNGDASKIIDNLLNEYEGDKNQQRKFLYEWIYQVILIWFMQFLITLQPGVVVLEMNRCNGCLVNNFNQITLIILLYRHDREIECDKRGIIDHPFNDLFHNYYLIEVWLP